MPTEFIIESTDGTDLVLQVDTTGNLEAFPRPGEASGLTKREYMATQMMAAYIALDPDLGLSNYDMPALARYAVAAADALLKALQDS